MVLGFFVVKKKKGFYTRRPTNKKLSLWKGQGKKKKRIYGDKECSKREKEVTKKDLHEKLLLDSTLRATTLILRRSF